MYNTANTPILLPDSGEGRTFVCHTRIRISPRRWLPEGKPCKSSGFEIPPHVQATRQGQDRRRRHIETGDDEIDADDLAATKRALAKRPDAVLYGVRIGYPTAYRLGGCCATPQP